MIRYGSSLLTKIPVLLEGIQYVDFEAKEFAWSLKQRGTGILSGWEFFLPWWIGDFGGYWYFTPCEFNEFNQTCNHIV